MTIYVGIDDTGNSESVGTGKFARIIAGEISKKYPVYGVTRHQFYVHPDINFSLHNFGAVIHVDTEEEYVDNIFESVKEVMQDNFNNGSNPGLAVAHESCISPAVVAYGKDAKETVIISKRAWNLALNSNIQLESIGGNGSGVIGAVAGLGLAYAGNDGRFLQIGRIRKLKGPQPVEKLIGAGIDGIFTPDGRPITKGIIFNEGDKPVKPCPVNGEVILFVYEENGIFKAVTRD
ncbi:MULTISPECIES: ABC transporter substrate-binding protein [Methanobacterium]|uniref:ABC transporter substrate-binding protein n=1 Tax=Methanobacterium bryantii TaxID=2161 RepID=A0A2A2H1L4_METBR|nr:MULTISPECIES: ABC transporter substrate-binding protein [Methanobacterium]OEC84286.1 ABC transporter substrate-binding protein [Methanobacterium sp. A39]PAV03245.1 ABC transporter substrate-binding protein [Methanobacterium bryantii]